MNAIFVVTTLHFKDRRYGPGTRPVAWYPTLEDAQRCIAENHGDIWETVYSHALIEQLEPGLYPDVKAEHWFVWNHEKRGYEPVTERPSEVAGVTSFSIG